MITEAVFYFTNNNIREGIKEKFGFFKIEKAEYSGKTVLLIKAGNNLRKKTFKRIIKKHKITIAAVFPENEENKEKINFPGVSIISEREEFIKLIPKIFQKAANSNGLQRGKIKVGLIACEESFKVLLLLTEEADLFSEICILGKNENMKEAADLFLDETGISVIFKENIKSGDCDILISLNSEDIPPDFEGTVICPEKKAEINGKIIHGIHLDLPPEAKIPHIGDVVSAKLFGTEMKITKLIV